MLAQPEVHLLKLLNKGPMKAKKIPARFRRYLKPMEIEKAIAYDYKTEMWHPLVKSYGQLAAQEIIERVKDADGRGRWHCLGDGGWPLESRARGDDVRRRVKAAGCVFQELGGILYVTTAKRFASFNPEDLNKLGAIMMEDELGWDPTYRNPEDPRAFKFAKSIGFKSDWRGC